VFSVTFQIDLNSGVPTGFKATTTISGPIQLLANGDVRVGSATLPHEVISSAARHDLTYASKLGLPATVVVDGTGTLDQSAPGGVVVDIRLTVTFVAPTPQPTPTAAQLPNTAMDGRLESASSYSVGLAILALLASVTLGALLALRLATWVWSHRQSGL
jgi:hypothetical protein